MKDKRLEVLDLKSAAVRETIQQAGDAEQLYRLFTIQGVGPGSASPPDHAAVGVSPLERCVHRAKAAPQGVRWQRALGSSHDRHRAGFMTAPG